MWRGTSGNTAVALGELLFKGDNTGATDVSAGITALHNERGMVVLPPGEFLISSALALTSVPKFSALIEGTVTLKFGNDVSGIEFSPPVAEVLNTSVNVTALTADQNAGYDDLLDRITVDAVPTGIDNEVYFHITSNNAIETSGDRWAGEAGKVAYYTTGTNKYIYPTHKLVNLSLYVTSPILSIFNMIHAGGYVRGIKFEASGNYEDQSIATRLAAIDVSGCPEFEVTDCEFDSCWSQGWLLRSCPSAVVTGNTHRRMPNIATYDSTAAQKTVTSATAANPAVFTFNAHGYSNGNPVYCRNATGGWSVLNGRTFIITNKATNTFRLTDPKSGVEVDSSGFGTYNGDLIVSLADVTGIGYSGSFYGCCFAARCDSSYTTETRHDGNTDGRGTTYSATSSRHLQGQPTYVEFLSSTSNAGIGPPNGSHEEGGMVIRRGRLTMYPYRGSQGGSYASMHDNERCLSSRSFNDVRIGGGLGIRNNAIQHSSVPRHHYNYQYFEGMKNQAGEGASILTMNQSSITNKQIVHGHDWVTNGTQRPYQFEASSKFRGTGTHVILAPDVRAIQFSGANSTIDFDRVLVDWRDTTTGSNCYPIVVDNDGVNPYTGNVLRINELCMILGDGATKPNSIIDVTGTIVGSAITLQISGIKIMNPSNIALPELCSSGDYAGITLDPSGMDFITLDLAAPQTVLTTSMKAMHVIERPFIPAIYIANVSTVSSSGLPTFDVNKNGTSVFGANKITIDVSETTSKTAATAATVASATLTPFVAGDIITVDVDVAGTGTQGGQVRIYGWFV